MNVINEFITTSEYRPEYFFVLPNYFETKWVEFKDSDVPDYCLIVVAVYRFDHQWGENKYMYRFMGVKVK